MTSLYTYGLNIEIWELLKQKEFKGEVGWPYYKANEISLVYYYKNIKRGVNADICPRSGRKLLVEATAAFDKLHSGEFEFMFRPKFRDNNFLFKFKFKLNRRHYAKKIATASRVVSCRAKP